METDQLACWLLGLAVQVCGDVTGPCDLPSLSVGHRTRKPSPNPSSGDLEALVHKESVQSLAVTALLPVCITVFVRRPYVQSGL